MKESRAFSPVYQITLFGVGKLAFLFVTILLYKALSPTDIGLFAVIYAIAIILATVSECGLRGLLVREIARSHDSPETATRLLAGAINARLLTLLPYLGFGLIAGFFFLSNQHMLVLLLLLTGAWLDSNAFVLRGALRACNQIILDASIAGLSRVILLVVTAYLYWQEQLTLLNFSILFAVIAVADVAATLGFIARRTGLSLSFTCSFDRIIAMIKRGTPFIVLNVLGIIYMRVAILLLGLFHTSAGLHEAAGFNLAAKIPEGVSFLPIALMNAAIPYFSRNSGDLNRILPVFRELELIMGCAGIIITTGLIMFADQFILLMATPEYLHYTTTFRLYAVTIFLTFLQYVYANLLICMDQEKRVARRYGIVLLANIAINLVLIWKFAALGAVITLLVCEVLAIAIDLRYLAETGVKLATRILLKWFALAVCCVALAYLASLVPSPYGLAIYWLCGGVLGVLVLVRTKFSAEIFKPDGNLPAGSTNGTA